MLPPSVLPLNEFDSSLYRVSWQKPETDAQNPIISYTIFRDDGSLGEITPLVSDLTGETYLESRVFEVSDPGDERVNSEGKLYRFQIAATNYVGMSKKSDVTVFQACKKPAPPDVFSGKNFLDTGLTLEWSPSSDPGGADCYITKYVVSHIAPGGQKVIDCVTSAQTRRCTVSGLLPGNAYSFQLTAFNQPSESEPVTYPSEGVVYRAGSAPPIPSGISFSNAQPGDLVLTISWDKLSDVLEITGFDMLVKLCNLPGDPVLVENILFNFVSASRISTDINQVVYGPLTTREPVCIQLRSKNLNDVSGWSEMKIFMVSDLPGSPQAQSVNGNAIPAVRYQQSNSTSIAIQWNAVAVASDRAPLTHYRISY